MTGSRTLLLISLLAMSPLALASAADQRFEKIYTREWQWRQSQVRVNEDSRTEAIPKSLPDVGAAAQRAHLEYWRGVKKQLVAIDRNALSYDNQLNLAVYEEQLDVLMSDVIYRTYERPLSGDTSFWGDLTHLARKTFRSEEDYRNYLQWLADMPRYFDQNIANMRTGLERGFTLPQITLRGRDATAASMVGSKPRDNVFFTPFKQYPASLSQKLRDELTRKGEEAVARYVVPAHRRVLEFLRREYIPGATESIAAYDLPDGEAFYRSRIKTFTTLDMTPDEIHRIGLDEVAGIRARMHEVMEEVGFDGDLQAFLHFLRTDPRFYAKTPQQLLHRAAWIAKEFDGKVADWFGRAPRSRFAIEPVPDDVAPFYTGGRGGPGIYLVNTYDLPSRPLYSLPALTLHESAPGHAFQMPLAAENEALPEFRRESYISAYGEGWALYSEKLGEEMGMYHSPYEVFGMLSYQMWRAARLVVDTGIHARGWTRKRAQDFLLDNTALSTHEVTTEVDRYIAWPGQALSYYLGQMAIEKSRARAEKALGGGFDIRAYHDTVLQMGSVPLTVLEARIDKFIRDGGESPYRKQ